MTSYTAIPNGDIDQDSPITQPLMTALRDNPIAIAEGDASVPANLFPTVLLGTLDTTSGSSVTLSGLTLTPYKCLMFEFRSVSTDNTLSSLRWNSGTGPLLTTTIATATNGFNGSAFVWLSTGAFSSVVGSVALDIPRSIDSQPWAGTTGITTASTSITIAIAVGTFDAGSIRIYGVK